jgi:hypothetical protein
MVDWGKAAGRRRGTDDKQLTLGEGGVGAFAVEYTGVEYVEVEYAAVE